MPPGKRRQSNAMLYTLMTFVGLFIIATTVAVVYYVKAEELRTKAEEAQNELNRMASSDEVRRLGDIVGAKVPGETQLGTMVQYFDRVVGIVTGTPVQATNAEIKKDSVAKAVAAFLSQARAYISLPAVEPGDSEPNAPAANQVSLMSATSDLLARLEQTIAQKQAVEQQQRELQNRFDDATALWQKTEQDLTAEVAEYRTLVEQTKADYNDLRTLVEQSSEQRVANLLRQLEDERTRSKQLNQDLLKTQAQLDVAQQRLGDALTEVGKVQPPPDHEAEAQSPDGKVILIDEAAGLVTINLGSDDRVYRGLTFSVYDSAGGIPRDGKPKAEIEAFAVDKKVSTARVLSSEKKNPITTNDLVANLIWDSRKINHFVIAGDFDLNGDGEPDYDADAGIQKLIQKWGAAVDNIVSAKTDFIILGTEPQVPPEPTFDELAADPMAREKYDRARQRQQRYDQIRQQARALYIPIFTYERFLYFTGYQSSVGKAGAF
ncbi:MAG: hypothetical protein JW955_25805 [Sedimentisphaerales bacterium]|nr:hypothetical protein [Sedimentisphaerales bacterium]